jgi:hypothetical protein
VGKRSRNLFHCLEVAPLMRAPHLDHDRRARPGDAPGLAKRRNQIVREEERVEAGDEVEAVVGPRELLHLTDAQVRLGQTLAGERDQRLGCVDAVRFGTALGNQTQEGSGAATDVEHAPAQLEPRAFECCLVRRALHVLAERPVRGTRTPNRSPARRAACAGG